MYANYRKAAAEVALTILTTFSSSDRELGTIEKMFIILIRL